MDSFLSPSCPRIRAVTVREWIFRRVDTDRADRSLAVAALIVATLRPFMHMEFGSPIARMCRGISGTKALGPRLIPLGDASSKSIPFSWREFPIASLRESALGLA